jgi:glycine oxidase
MRKHLIQYLSKRGGFHLAPIISDQLVRIISKKDFDQKFLGFSPEGNLIRSLTRQQGIERGVKHLLSADYQHGFTPALNRMPEKLEKAYKEDLEQLHDAVKAYDWGTPPELIEMYRHKHAK